MILASIAVAGLWEIGEYTLSGVVGRDLQRVMATGVADSMQDMGMNTVAVTVDAMTSWQQFFKNLPICAELFENGGSVPFPQPEKLIGFLLGFGELRQLCMPDGFDEVLHGVVSFGVIARLLTTIIALFRAIVKYLIIYYNEFNQKFI